MPNPFEWKIFPEKIRIRGQSLRIPYAGMLFNGLGRPIDLNRPCQTLPASMGGNKTPIIDTRLLHDPDAVDWLVSVHAKAQRGADMSKVKVPSRMRRRACVIGCDPHGRFAASLFTNFLVFVSAPAGTD